MQGQTFKELEEVFVIILYLCLSVIGEHVGWVGILNMRLIQKLSCFGHGWFGYQWNQQCLYTIIMVTFNFVRSLDLVFPLEPRENPRFIS